MATLAPGAPLSQFADLGHAMITFPQRGSVVWRPPGLSSVTIWNEWENRMSTFEEGFAATERAADSVLQALVDVSRLARQLQRDAKAGNIAGIRRGTARLEESLALRSGG